MPNGPLTYVRARLARAIELRVQSATEALRADMTVMLEDLRAQQRAELQAIDVESRRRHAELVDMLVDTGRVADADRGSNVHFRELLAKELSSKITATNTSLGSISASITDAQRRQANFVEQLARRIEALEASPRPVVAETTEPAS